MTEILQLFWDKGIKKISPGALGMTLGCRPPLTDHEAQSVDGAEWIDGWIVLSRRPECS